MKEKRETEKGVLNPPIHSLVCQESESASWPLLCVSKAQILGPPAGAFQGALAGGWIEMELVEIKLHTFMGHQLIGFECHRWWLDLH